MKVTRDTAYDEVFCATESMMTDDDKAALEAAAVRSKFGGAGFWGMTLGGLFAAMKGDLDAVATEDEAATAFGVYRLRAFPGWLEEFLAADKALTPPPTARERRLAQGCRQMTFPEATYVFVRRYFGLPSFDAVNAMTVADYLLARKDDYNRIVADRNAAAAARRKGGMT